VARVEIVAYRPYYSLGVSQPVIVKEKLEDNQAIVTESCNYGIAALQYQQFHQTTELRILRTTNRGKPPHTDLTGAQPVTQSVANRQRSSGIASYKWSNAATALLMMP